MKLQELPSKEIFPGCVAKFIHGQQSTLAFWEISKGSIFKEHAHFHEQITYIIEGEMQMVIGGEHILLTGGSTHVIPPNTPHSAFAISDCKVIDSFTPARDDYR